MTSLLALRRAWKQCIMNVRHLRLVFFLLLDLNISKPFKYRCLSWLGRYCNMITIWECFRIAIQYSSIRPESITYITSVTSVRIQNLYATTPNWSTHYTGQLVLGFHLNHPVRCVLDYWNVTIAPMRCPFDNCISCVCDCGLSKNGDSHYEDKTLVRSSYL